MTSAPTLCLDLGGTEIKAALAIGDRLVTRSTTPFDARTTDRSLDAILAVARDLLAGARVGAPAGVGIAVPGIVDSDGRTMTAAFGKFVDLTGVDLAEWGQRSLGAPARVEQDARAALVGELAAGPSGVGGDAVLVTLGTGIGTAATVNGEVVRGGHGHGGILGGHVTVEVDGPECPCGNVGCAEAVASTWALPAAVRRHPDYDDSAWPAVLASGDVGIADLLRLESAGDPVAVDVLARFLRVWGSVVVTMAHAFDPDLVVLTGGVLRGGDRIAEPIRRHVDAHLWPSMRRPPIVVPEHPESSVLRGLARFAHAPDGSGDGTTRERPAPLVTAGGLE